MKEVKLFINQSTKGLFVFSLIVAGLLTVAIIATPWVTPCIAGKYAVTVLTSLLVPAIGLLIISIMAMQHYVTLSDDRVISHDGKVLTMLEWKNIGEIKFSFHASSYEGNWMTIYERTALQDTENKGKISIVLRAKLVKNLPWILSHYNKPIEDDLIGTEHKRLKSLIREHNKRVQ